MVDRVEVENFKEKDLTRKGTLTAKVRRPDESAYNGNTNRRQNLFDTGTEGNVKYGFGAVVRCRTESTGTSGKTYIERFPVDFMFQLTKEEFLHLKSQIVTSSWGGLRRATPYAFTENGVAMLSSVLKSKRAIQVNVQIMRTFTKLREMIASHKDLVRKLDAIEKKYDEQFQIVFEAIRHILEVEDKQQRKIGFIVKESRAVYKKSRKLVTPKYKTGLSYKGHLLMEIVTP